MPDSIDNKLGLFELLKAEKGTLESYLQEVTEFILPRKTQVTTYEATPGQRQEWRRFDHIGMNSNQMLAASIHGALTSSATQWFNMDFDDEDLREDSDAKEWLAECAKQMYRELNNSNFANRIMQTYLDLGGYGTAALGVWERTDMQGRFDGLRFVAYPIREYVFQEGPDDRPRAFYRHLRMKASRIFDEFPKSMPGFVTYGRELNDIRNRNDPKELEQEFDILICISPRQNYKEGSPAPNRRPVAHEVIEMKNRVRIVQSGTYEMPVMIPRWEVNADDHGWGRGPGMTALSAVRQRSKLKYYGQRAVAKDVDPALVVEHRGIFGQIRTGPGGIIYKRKNATDPYPLTSGARYDAAQLEKDELRREIEEYFFVDQLRPFHQTPQMTATEAQLRFELMMRLLGPTYGRLVYELFDPLLYRVFQILLRNGRLPEPPAIVRERMETQGTNIKVEYVGPLAKAQRAKDVQAIERTYSLGQTIAAATGRTNHLDLLDDEAALREGVDVLGTPPAVVRSDDDVQKIRAQRAEQERRQQATEQATEQAEAMRAAGQGVESIARARTAAAGGRNR